MQEEGRLKEGGHRTVLGGLTVLLKREPETIHRRAAIIGKRVIGIGINLDNRFTARSGFMAEMRIYLTPPSLLASINNSLIGTPATRSLRHRPKVHKSWGETASRVDPF